MKKITYLLSLILLSFSCKNSEVLFGQGKVSAGSAEPVKLDLEILHNLIFVPVEIGGKSYRFLFDSGAPMVVSKELRARLKLDFVKRNSVRDSQGEIQNLDYVKLDQLSLGGEVFEDLVAIEADLRLNPILNCLDFDGIVGANLMQFRYWEMNLADSSLIMAANKNHWPAAQGPRYRIPFARKATRTPVLELSINGKQVSGITFDTGSSGVLSLPKQLMSELGADSLVLERYGFLSGGLYGSAMDTAQEHYMAFTFPDSSHYHFPVEIESNKSSALLGMDFLKHWRVFMDWSAQEIILEPISSYSTKPIFPLGPHFDEVVTVGQINHLLANQTQLPIAVGDTILACNGVSYVNSSKEDYCRILEQFKQGDTLLLKVKGRGELEIRREYPYQGD